MILRSPYPELAPVLFRDEFATDSSGLATGTRSGEVGSSTVTNSVVGNLTIAGGDLRMTGGVADRDPKILGSTTRARGRALLMVVKFDNIYGRIGWGASPNPAYPIYGIGRGPGASTVYLEASGGNNTVTWAATLGQLYEVLIPLRSTQGAWFFIRPSGTNEWTLAYISEGNTATAFTFGAWTYSDPSPNNPNITMQRMLLVDLSTYITSDTFFNTIGPIVPTSGYTNSHPADCQIRYSVTSTAAVGHRLILRRTDASNYWYLDIGSTARLFQVINGAAPVQRGSSSAGLAFTTGGNTLTPYIVLEGNKYSIFSADGSISRITYTDTANTSNNATGLEVQNAGATGTSNFQVYPRFVALPELP